MVPHAASEEDLLYRAVHSPSVQLLHVDYFAFLLPETRPVQALWLDALRADAAVNHPTWFRPAMLDERLRRKERRASSAHVPFYLQMLAVYKQDDMDALRMVCRARASARGPWSTALSEELALSEDHAVYQNIRPSPLLVWLEASEETHAATTLPPTLEDLLREWPRAVLVHSTLVGPWLDSGKAMAFAKPPPQPEPLAFYEALPQPPQPVVPSAAVNASRAAGAAAFREATAATRALAADRNGVVVTATGDVRERTSFEETVRLSHGSYGELFASDHFASPLDVPVVGPILRDALRVGEPDGLSYCAEGNIVAKLVSARHVSADSLSGHGEFLFSRGTV